MKDNLIARYCTCQELKGELLAEKKHHGWMSYFETKRFLKSIEGKVVDLTFTCGDAFELEDNNYWLPESLWDAI